MDIRNCPKCRQVFTYVNSPYCPMCEKEEEKIFETVRVYIKENQNASMVEVVEATGVSMKKITRYIKEGRLEIAKGMHGEIICESCHKPIKTGKFCDTCLIRISNEMELKPLSSKSVAKMHTRQR